MAVRALKDQVICIKQEIKETTFGLIIPEGADKLKKALGQVAKVVSVGMLCEETKEGDTILLLRDGVPLTHKGIDYIIVKERAEDYCFCDPE